MTKPWLRCAVAVLLGVIIVLVASGCVSLIDKTTEYHENALKKTKISLFNVHFDEGPLVRFIETTSKPEDKAGLLLIWSATTKMTETEFNAHFPAQAFFNNPNPFAFGRTDALSSLRTGQAPTVVTDIQTNAPKLVEGLTGPR